MVFHHAAPGKKQRPQTRNRMTESEMMQGVDWSGQDPTRMIVMEKFRGCRGEWDGERLWSKNGNIIPAPAWFTAGLPRRARLTGEIYAGRCKVETAARLATQYGHFELGVHSFRVFDAPHAPGNVQERVARAASLIANAPHAAPVAFTVCAGLDHLVDALREIQDAGGEGLMLHHPSAPWQAGRTANLLKVKKPI
jgi:DNA ligase-1